MARASNLTMCSFCGKSHSEVRKCWNALGLGNSWDQRILEGFIDKILLGYV